MEQAPDRLKNWSASSTKKFAETKGEFKLLHKPDFKCVFCKKDIIASPVSQCQTGHLVCIRCSRRGRSCPLCFKAITRIKNVAIGKIIDSPYVTCKYANLGCTSNCKYKSQTADAHEKRCPFVPMNCPMPGCRHAGVTSSLEQHLISKHNITALVNVNSFSLEFAASFNLDSLADAQVLLRNERAKDFHLLHQETSDLGDRLVVTSMVKSSKRQYEIDVEIEAEQKYCYKFESTTNTDQNGGLLIPKQPGGAPLKTKRCRIRMD